MDKGLLERIKNTSLPGRGISAAENWEFDGAGVNAVLPTTEPHSMASMIHTEKNVSNRWNAHITVIRREQDLELDVEAPPSHFCFLGLFSPL